MSPNAVTAGALDLFYFSNTGVIGNAIGTAPVSAAEHPHNDALRCGVGFCLFLTSDAADANSWLYNVSWSGAAITSRVALPGVLARNLHMYDVDFSAWTLALSATTNPRTAVVTRVLGGVATPWVDVSAAVGNGTVWPGGTTHCSATNTMYIAVDAPDGESDKLLAVSLTSKSVASVINLNFPVPTALWANCGTGVVGGCLVFSAGQARQTAVVGEIHTDGSFYPLMSQHLPAPPVGMPNYEFSGTFTADFEYAYLAPLYPGAGGVTPLANGTGGMLWLPDPAGGAGNETLVPFSTYLVGAALQWTN
jgi:hypothetical protein